MARGFYSVVQYMPNRFRAEAVNVGLILLRLEPHALRVRMTTSFDRVRRLFGTTEAGLVNLRMSVSGLEERVRRSADDFRTEEDLAAFAASRANDLRLTPPRLAILENIDDDMERLFSDLVDDNVPRAVT